ncbi:MAG: hypothetical protein AAF479_00235 [Pseudomonadota bacterium]
MFQVDSEWTRVEDILTADFFGALDYLPRDTHLARFMEAVAALNDNLMLPELSATDWNSVEMIFWPRESVDGQQVEPDVVVVSSNWTLIVEVKLESGLGYRQPWREYQAGLSLARTRGVPTTAVFYLVVARGALNVAGTFEDGESTERDELLGRTLFLPWWRAALIVDSWRSESGGTLYEAGAHRRLIDDVLASLHRRRSILFSGFRFANIDSIQRRLTRVFCPPAFAGFAHRDNVFSAAPTPLLFLNQFDGFLSRTRRSGPLSAPDQHSRVFLQRPAFSFLARAPRCQATRVWSSYSRH